MRGRVTTDRDRVSHAASVVGGATLLSRVLGYIRDMVIARTFGAGTATDAFWVAFRIPNTLRELLGEGALSAAFVPVFTEHLTRRGREAAWALASRALTLLAVILLGIVGLGILAAPAVVWILAPGFSQVPDKVPLTVLLTRLMFPYIFCVGIAALLMGVLNSLRQFLMPALSPTLLNVAMIIAALALPPFLSPPILALAVGVLIGGFGQLLVQVPAARRQGMPFRVTWETSDPGVRQIGRLMLPGVMTLGMTQFSVFIDSFLASFLAEGSVSYLTFAFRLIQLPIGVVGVAIGTATFPVLSTAAARGDRGKLLSTLSAGIRQALFLTLPALVGLLLFRQPIVYLLFEGGRFSRAATEATAAVLFFYAMGLCFYVINRILLPTYYALQDTRTPMAVGGIWLTTKILLSLLLIRPLAAGGLALATAIASAVNLGCLLLFLFRRHGLTLHAEILTSGGKSSAAALLMGGLSAVLLTVADPFAVTSVVWRVALILGEIGVSALFYMAVALGLKSEEARALLRLLRPRGRPV